MNLRPKFTASLGGVAVALLVAGAYGLSAPTVQSGEVSQVVVTNLPEVQQVAGVVAIDRPIPGTALVHLTALVAPVARTETTSLVPAGALNAVGYAEVVLSLRGEIQSTLHRDGTVGVLLLPEQEPILRAFLEAGVTQFPLETSAEARRVRQGHFASPRGERQVLAFPRYRVYFFNTTDKPAEVDLYAYLSN